MLAGLVLTGAFGPTLEGRAESVPVLSMEKRSELIDSEERISGGATLGVLYVDQGDKPALDALFVFLADPIKTPLELQLTTVDGRYVGTFEYEPKSPAQGWVRLDVPVSQIDFLKGYAINELAPLVTDGQSAMALPVRWGVPRTSEQVRLFLNTEGATSYFVSYDREKDRLSARQCAWASRRSSFKFDRICDVPVDDITGKNHVEVLRKRGTAYGTSLQVGVYLGGSEN